LVYGTAVIVLVGGIIFISYFIGERHDEPATDEQYESGIKATGNARLRFPVHYYLVAMCFVIFDVAAVFIISWAIAIRDVGWQGYLIVTIFIGVLMSVLFYLSRIGVFSFGPDGKKILNAYHEKIKVKKTI
jgi:NADH-quinone oxidoreductase subunit A